MIEIGQSAVARQACGGWVSLTLIQTKVDMLREEGLSNPEIVANLSLSRRHHPVSPILPKLEPARG